MHSNSTPILGLIAGRGELPLNIKQACNKDGRTCFVLAFTGMEPDKVTADVVTRVGAVSDTIAALKAAGVTQLVLAGHMKRPSILSLKPDAEGAKLIARLGKAIFAGDDALLTALIGYLEEQGFEVLSTQDVLGNGILAPAGTLSARAPTPEEMDTIRIGLNEARAHGAADKGQAVVVHDDRVIATETEHGTDALIASVHVQGAILVKACKPQQERRVDLPTIGADTIDALARHCFAGVAVEAEKTLLLSREETIQRANTHGVFIVGVN